MLKLRRVEIDNFVCFEKVVIEPSTDREKPLTVLRAENGSARRPFYVHSDGAYMASADYLEARRHGSHFTLLGGNQTMRVLRLRLR